MQGLGTLLDTTTKEWVFAYFKNNLSVKEFEKGTLKGHQSSLPNFAVLEQKYDKFIT